MFCKNCGAKMDDDAKFCVNCGWKIGDNVTKTQNSNNGKINLKKFVPIIIGVLLTIIAIVIIKNGIFNLKNSNIYAYASDDITLHLTSKKVAGAVLFQNTDVKYLDGLGEYVKLALEEVNGTRNNMKQEELMAKLGVSSEEELLYKAYPNRTDYAERIVIDDKIKPISTVFMFERMVDLKEIIGIENLDVSNVKNMCGMFAGCRELTNLNVSNWDTSKVTDMSFMFTECQELTNLNVSNWDTGKVTDMTGMFAGCSNLTTLDVSKWDTKNVITMGHMFTECNNLTNLDVSNWNTKKVIDISTMFSD